VTLTDRSKSSRISFRFGFFFILSIKIKEYMPPSISRFSLSHTLIRWLLLHHSN
jgi:hypothetical protein